MEFLFAFLLGMFTATILIMAYGWYQVNKIKKAAREAITHLKGKVEEVKSLEEKKDSIKERLTKASELAQAQMAIRAQMEMPSKNALHSRYKNGLVGELQDMEQQKLDLLKTVLAEGFDPLITVINESGSSEQIPLSAYVSQATGILNEAQGTNGAPPPPPPTDPTQPKKAGKFMVYKGGKDDGTTH